MAVSLTKTEASIGDGAVVKAKGDINILANSDSLTVIAAGGVGGGKDAGVGASIAANVIANQTQAKVGKNAELASTGQTTIAADANETVVSAVIAGAGGGQAGVAGAISVNLLLTDTEASVDQGTEINTDTAYDNPNQAVAITARDDTVIVSATGGAAGGGKAGVGAALDTNILIKQVKAFVADDTVSDAYQADIQATKDIKVDAVSTENIVSVVAGFAGGGTAGVGGAVGVGVVDNDVQAYVGKSAKVDTDSNVLINAEDDITAVLTAGAGAGGGTAGVGASLAVATLLGSTKAFIGDEAKVNARGLGDAASVYSGETAFSDTDIAPADFLAKQKEDARGLSVTAYSREKLITTVVGGAGGGTAGVAATVSANVIANTTEASIGRSAKINDDNTGAATEQQVRVKAIDETLLIDTAGAGAGGGTAGVGAAANVGVIAKIITAKIGSASTVNAKKAVELTAASSDLSVTTTAGFAGGGSAGVGGAVAGVGVDNKTKAYIEDAASAADAAKVKVTGGDLKLSADEFSSSWLITGAGAGGGAAGVGVSLAAGVNTSTTLAKIGDYAETNASGTTSVKADSTENVNTITVAGAGGGAAGVAGTISVNVVASTTEAGIGKHANVNQDSSITSAAQSVDVSAFDMIIANSVGGVGAGGGAAGVGATINVLVAQNTTSAYIDNEAKVDASKNIKVDATSEKYVNSATVAGGGAGAAGVTGAVSIIAVGSLFDDDAKSGLGGSNTSDYADGQLNKSAVGNQMGSSTLASGAAGNLNSRSEKLAVGQYMDKAKAADIPLKNTQAFIGDGADVKAGENIDVTAKDSTQAIIASVAGAGGGAAGVSGSLGVVLLHDSAAAFIADGAKVDAGNKLNVAAETEEDVYNVGVTGSGAGAAAVDGALVVNVISSNTAAYIGDADINGETAFATSKTAQSVAVTANSNSNLVSVAGSGGGAGAASVGGVVNVNTLTKKTQAFIDDDATVNADTDVDVAAESAQSIIGAGVAIRGAGAAAVSAVASVNVVDNTTEAYLGARSSVDSNGNVSLAATDDTLIVAVSAVGNGAGAAGVGANVGANVVSSQTRAYVGEGGTVNARGNAAATTVYDGTVSSTPAAMPALAGGESGALDINRDGVADDDVSDGAKFNVSGQTVNAGGEGLGAKGTTSVKGLSVTAVGNEKIISTTIGVAGAGAAAVTGAASVNVVSSTTEAYIANQAKINQTGGVTAGSDVRVKATDNTFMVQTGSTVAGAGAAAVSGSLDTGIVGKHTHAYIGDADVDAANVTLAADSSEDISTVTTNVSVGGAAGVGGAVGVNVVTNETLAYIKAGADVDASGNLDVNAKQKTVLDMTTVSGAGGGAAGVSGALSVGVIGNTTKAYVEDGTDATSAATLNAGKTLTVKAVGEEEMTTTTVSGAAGGYAGVAGAVAVKVTRSTTEAAIGDFTKVNQTRSSATQDVIVQADDTVTLRGGGGSGSASLVAGVGATVDVNIVRNTTAAHLGASTEVDAGRNINITANATKDVQSTAVAAAGGNTAGIAGAVSVVSIGAALDGDTQAKLGDTTNFSDSKIKTNNVSQNLGDSSHVTGLKGDVSGGVGKLGVAGDMNQATTDSLDKTLAYIGSSSQVVAEGDVTVKADDKLKIAVTATGAAGGAVGIGGAVGVAVAHGTTEAYIGSSATIDTKGIVAIDATAKNLDSDGTLVKAGAGAGGVVGASAAIAVMDDSSTTKAYLGENAEIVQSSDLSVSARTVHKARSEALGAGLGGIAVGASEAFASFTGETTAYAEDSVKIGKNSGKNVTKVSITATDNSSAVTRAVAGAAGIYSGAGAAAQSIMKSTVHANLDDDTDVEAQGTVAITATSTASATAEAVGVSVGYGAVGISSAVATVDNDVSAEIGSNSKIEANQLNVQAETAVSTATGLTAKAVSYGASGGLVGLNGTSSVATHSGSTHSKVGDNTTITGSAEVKATTNSKQQANASGVAVGGYLALGANIAVATSDSDTLASVGKKVSVEGDMLSINALGSDENNAQAIAGSGGMVAGSAAVATTTTSSNTQAKLGSGDNTHKINVGSFNLKAEHTGRFNGELDSLQASIVGASGAVAAHTANSIVLAAVEKDALVLAKHVDIDANNLIDKPWLGSDGDSAHWNIISGSGGLLNGPAGHSETHIVQDTTASIGDSAYIHVMAPTSGEGTFTMDAYNEITAHDKTKLDSGGAIALALSDSMIYVDKSDATVSFGKSAVVISDLGNIGAGARSDIELDVRAVANTYGLAGAPAGNAYAKYTGNNRAVIAEGARLTADDGEIALGAGQDSAGVSTKIDARSTVNLWNKTAIPIATIPNAQSSVVSNASLVIEGGAVVEAAGDIALSADKGNIDAAASGIGKDIYREEAAKLVSGISNLFGGGDVSFDIRGGSSSKQGTANVEVDGTVQTGLKRFVSLEFNAQLVDVNGNAVGTAHYRYFDENGGQICIGSQVCPGYASKQVMWKLVPSTIGNVTYSVSPGEAGTGIVNRINLLQKLMAQYYGDTVAVNAYAAEISFLQLQLVQLGLASIDSNGKVVMGSFSGPTLKQQEAIKIMENAGAANTLQTTLTGNPTDTSLSNTVKTVLDDYSTIATNNTTITAKLSALSKAPTPENIGSNNTYNNLTTQIANANTLKNEIITLQSEINAQNTGYQSKIAVKTLEIQNLSNKSSRTTADLTTIADDSNQIAVLLGKIADNNSALAAKTAELKSVLGQITTEQNALKSAWADGGNSADTTLVTAIGTLLSNNSTPISKIGDASTALTSAYDTNFAPTNIDSYTTQAAILGNLYPTLSDAAAKGPSVDYIKVDDVTARLGNIRIKGDNLTGSGGLNAPGDAQISIVNNTPDFLTLGKLTVDNANGGLVTLNDVLVNKNADVNRLNTSGSGASFSSFQTRDNQGAGVPKIIVESTYDPSNYNIGTTKIPGMAPSIELQGDVANTLGEVKIHSKAGNIYVDGNINAASVSIQADKGDFVQSYVNGFDHIAGDPANNSQGGSASSSPGTQPGSGILANGSVMISARYLNINGTIQSGVENYTLTLSSSAELTASATALGVDQSVVDAYRKSYQETKGYDELVSIYNAKITAYTTAKALWDNFHGLMSTSEPVAPVAPVNPHAAKTTTFTSQYGGSVNYDAELNLLTVDQAFANAAHANGSPTDVYTLVKQAGDNIGASYDAANKRYVVEATEVRGGYIQLYGQIINTCNTGSGCTTPGTLKVLDGYGQINIKNPTDLPVVLNTLDTGADQSANGRGIEGKIDITDIRNVDSNNNVTAIHSVITRENGAVKVDQSTETFRADGTIATVSGNATDTGIVTSGSDSRSASYSPQAGMRYVWTDGTTSKTETYWVYKGVTFLGISSTNIPTGADVVSQSGPHKLSEYRLDDGTYLLKDTDLTGTVLSQNAESHTTEHTYVKTDEWSKCNWWTLCVAQNTYAAWTETEGTLTVTSHSLKADNPINIQFIGSDSGTVNINSKSTVIQNGLINNASGTTTITAGTETGLEHADQSILQGAPGALIKSKDLTLKASGDIGNIDLANQISAPVQIGIGGVLNASAANGNIALTQTNGDLRIASVSASGDALATRGRITLTSDGDIVAAAPGSLLQGNMIDLTSRNGGIGALDALLKINVGYSVAPDARAYYGLSANGSDDMLAWIYYGLKADARGDIGIQANQWSGNTVGNLLVNTVVSRGGDVKLSSPGSIVDNNPIEAIDTRTWKQLTDYWDSVGLRAGTGANTDKQAQVIASFQNGRTQDYRTYWQMRQRQADPSVYDPNFVYQTSSAEKTALSGSGVDIATFEAERTEQYHRLNDTVGGYTTTYSTGFSYVATAQEQADMLHGSSWTDRELGISISPGLLKDITNTNPVVKSANVSGRNVSLEAGTSLGETRDSLVVIPVDTLPENLTDTQKVALAAAERSDLTITDTEITIKQRKPLNFEATQALNSVVAAAPTSGTDSGSMFLASMKDGLLGTISAQGETRIKVRGSIVNVSDTSPAVQTGNLILEAAEGGIGYLPDTGHGITSRPLRLSLGSADLIARATENVDIVQDGDLDVDTVFSRKNVKLTAIGSIYDAFDDDELNVLGETVSLHAQNGSVGRSGYALEVGNNLTGHIDANTANGIYLRGLFGQSFIIGDLNAGADIYLNSLANMGILGTVTAPTALNLVAGGRINMAATASLASATGNIQIDTGGLSMADGSAIRADIGTVTVSAQGDVIVGKIEATNNAGDDAIRLSAEGRILDAGDTGGADLVATTPGARLTLKAKGGVGVAKVSGGVIDPARSDPLEIEVAELEAASQDGSVLLDSAQALAFTTVTAGEDVSLSSGASISGRRVEAGRDAVLRSGDSINVQETTATSGNATLSAANAINADAVKAGTSANLEARTTLTFDTIEAGLDAALRAGGNITGRTLAAGRNISMDSDSDIKMDNVTATTGTAKLVAAGSITADKVAAGNLADLNAVAGDIAVNKITARRMKLAAGGKLDMGEISASDALSFSSTTLTANITHSGSGSHPLLLSVTGPGGAPATMINLKLSSPVGFEFSQFKTQDSVIGISNGFLQIDDGYVGNVATFQNPVSRVRMDNSSHVIRPADIQLYVPSKAFSNFKLDGWNTISGPYVLMRDPNHGSMMGDLRDSSAIEAARAGIEERIGIPSIPEALHNHDGTDDLHLIVQKPGLVAAVQVTENAEDNSEKTDE